MLRSISSLPISRRLFVAFALAAILPGLMISIMGIYYVNQLNEHGTIAALTNRAQIDTTKLSGNLGDMYNQTKVLEAQVLNGLTVAKTTVGKVDGGPNLSPINGSVSGINKNIQTYEQNLSEYNDQYNPMSHHMDPIQNAVNASHPNDATINQANTLLDNVRNTDWAAYKQNTSDELQLLQSIVGQAGTLVYTVIPDNASSATIAKIKADNAAIDAKIIGYRDQITQAAQKTDTSYSTLSTDWHTIVTYMDKLSGYANQTTADIQPVVFGSVSSLLLIMAVVIFVGFAVQRSITSPLTELVSLTRRISKGDTNARVKIEGRDEISIVANAMNNMLDNIVHLIQDTQAQRDVLQGQVEKLVSEVSGVGEGDLRVQAEVTADALGVLADSFNYMVEELGSLVVRVKMVAREVEESTTMTSDRMNELVETADRQIQQIAGAALEIERMAMTSQQVANRATALASSAREARLSAQGGRQAVQQTIEGMGRISLNVQETSSKVQNLGERSREINNIVEVISTIAHQTNRLALDAAIQAAMAGDNGKGFGAVAADIRRLAERAKEEANSIGRIVRSVRDEIGSVAVSMRDTERETSIGARLAEEAGTSLESIFSVIERQGREIDIINQMATQQQQSSNSVVQIMQGVSESTQESSGSTRDAAQNMERVARLAEQLLASVEAFKLREGLNYFAPNGNNVSVTPNEDGILTMSGAFRTVTSTAMAQPISQVNNSFAALPPPSSGNGFTQFSPSFPMQGGPANGQPFFPQQGFNNSQPPFPPQGPNSGQLSFPSQGFNNNQQPFPQQGAGNVQQPFPPLDPSMGQQPFPPMGNRAPSGAQWPAPNNDWQSGSSNW